MVLKVTFRICNLIKEGLKILTVENLLYRRSEKIILSVEFLSFAITERGV